MSGRFVLAFHIRGFHARLLDLEAQCCICILSHPQDPSFNFSRDDETGQTVIEGMGELHLEIIVDRLKREFKVEADVGAPQVSSAKQDIHCTSAVAGRLCQVIG